MVISCCKHGGGKISELYNILELMISNPLTAFGSARYQLCFFFFYTFCLSFVLFLTCSFFRLSTCSFFIFCVRNYLLLFSMLSSAQLIYVCNFSIFSNPCLVKLIPSYLHSLIHKKNNGLKNSNPPSPSEQTKLIVCFNQKVNPTQSCCPVQPIHVAKIKSKTHLS